MARVDVAIIRVMVASMGTVTIPVMSAMMVAIISPTDPENELHRARGVIGHRRRDVVVQLDLGCGHFLFPTHAAFRLQGVR